ncbi:MAG: AsmA-like C-terminal region-containing protein [Hyphomonas sp.]|uniref:AsmA family protein n=2 Tax=Hyphomonas sp. TaxID=87 RepID=UPI0032631467
MPDLHLPRSLEVIFDIACALLVSFAIFLFLMTFPAVATPVTNWSLAQWGPDNASVSRAHVRFPSVNEMILENFQAPGTAEAKSGEIRLNFFGFLPGLSWVSRARAENGFIVVQLDEQADGEDGLSLRDWRALIDEVRAEDIIVRFVRKGDPQSIHLQTAAGSLRSGDLSVSASGTGVSLNFEGRARPSDLSVLTGKLNMSGENFADFAELAGFASPDTPPYQATAYLTFSRQQIALDFAPSTRIGDSDLSGPMKITFGEATPRIEADLQSASLDFDDLGVVFGIPVGVGDNETTNQVQVASRTAFDASDRLIPDAVIDFSRLDSVDGHVAYHAQHVNDAIFDIRSLKLEFDVEGRVVRAPLLRVDFDSGQLISYVTLDATQSPATTTTQGTLNNVQLSNLALDPYVRGSGNGEFELEARGNGFRDAAATLNGRVSVWSKDADLLALAAEGAALDLGEALTLLGEQSEDRTYTPARCAAISIHFENGTGQLDPAIMDTADSLVIVEGQVGMRQERLDLKVRSEAKDASFGTLIGNVGIGGTFRSPEISALSAETVLQLGATALLASVSGGLAALPFIEPGMAEDAPCGAIMRRAQGMAP